MRKLFTLLLLPSYMFAATTNATGTAATAAAVANATVATVPEAAAAATPTAAAPADTIAVICLNDFHGGFVRDADLGIPGAGNIYSTVRSLQERYPANLTIAVGDNFGGSFFSNQTQGELIPYFFDKLGIRASALGNHEFDNGQAFLAGKWSAKRPAGWNITYICGNLEDERGHKTPAYAVPDTLCQVTVQGKPVKIGLIGLITKEAGTSTKSVNVEHLDFKKIDSAMIKGLCSKKSVRDADIQVLVAHVGTEMKNGAPSWMEKDFPAKLPKSVKGIASGHSHKYVEGKIGGVPVVQGEINGKRIGVLRFVKVNGRWEKTSPLVVRVGNVQDTSPVRREIDSVITSKLNGSAAPGMGMSCYTARVGRGGLQHDRNVNKDSLTALGSYVCNAYAWAYRKYAGKEDMDNIVLAFSHFGGIRRSLPAGKVSVLAAGEVLPFANELRVYELSGLQIRKLIEAGLGNPKGRLQMNNLVVDMVRKDNAARVVNVHYVIPGRQDIVLDDSARYPVVVDEFVATGGDGYDPALFPESAWVRDIRGLYTTPSFLGFLWSLGGEMTEDYVYKGRIRRAQL